MPARGIFDPAVAGERELYAAIDAVAKAHLSFGLTVILSDGDVLFQPLQMHRSGVFEAVDGRILIYIHKENELDDVEQRFPAEHYVLVDDKVRILAAMKQQWGERVTTVFPRQGHYALGPDVARYPSADLTIDRIGDFVSLDAAAHRRGEELRRTTDAYSPTEIVIASRYSRKPCCW